LTVHAAELRIQKRAFEVYPQTARSAHAVFVDLVRGFDDLVRCVQHRFEWCRHDAGKEAGSAATRVFDRCDRDGVTLIAIEQRVGGAVGMYVDEARGDGCPGRKVDVPRTVGR
jgi:hypothetical protein